MNESNVDISLLVRRAQRERAAVREIRDRGQHAFGMMLLGVGMAISFGSLAVILSFFYAFTLWFRVIG